MMEGAEVVEGHAGVVRAECLLPNGQRSLNQRRGLGLVAYDTADGTELAQAVGHAGVVRTERPLPDGQRLASTP